MTKVRVEYEVDERDLDAIDAIITRRRISEEDSTPKAIPTEEKEEESRISEEDSTPKAIPTEEKGEEADAVSAD